MAALSVSVTPLSCTAVDCTASLSRYGQEYGGGEYPKYGGNTQPLGGYPAQHQQYSVYRAEESRRINGRYPNEYDEVRMTNNAFGQVQIQRNVNEM